MLHQHNKHWWFSCRILACHAGDRGSIPPPMQTFFISNTYQVLCKFFSSNRWLGKMWNIFVICQVFFIANSKQTADSDSFLFHTTLHCMVVTKIRTLVYITTNQSIQKKNVKKENWIVLVTRQIQMII